MLYAPPVIDLTEDKISCASVDAAADLQEYARCWQRALSGYPLHFDNVLVKEYFVGMEELAALQAMYNCKDKFFKRK